MYAFNHAEAIKSFRRAAELDAELAMAYWGIALGLGSNYNVTADPAQLKEAYETLQKAIQLAPKASELDRDYIAALSKRYSADGAQSYRKQLGEDYKNAMRELVSTGRPRTRSGKSHSCEMPTSCAPAPTAHTISVAEGSSEITRKNSRDPMLLRLVRKHRAARRKWPERVGRLRIATGIGLVARDQPIDGEVASGPDRALEVRAQDRGGDEVESAHGGSPSRYTRLAPRR